MIGKVAAVIFFIKEEFFLKKNILPAIEPEEDKTPTAREKRYPINKNFINKQMGGIISALFEMRPKMKPPTVCIIKEEPIIVDKIVVKNKIATFVIRYILSDKIKKLVITEKKEEVKDNIGTKEIIAKIFNNNIFETIFV